MNKFQNICGRVISLIQYVVGYLFVRPKKDRIGFMSLQDYSDNARALSEYVCDNFSMDYEIIWFVKNPLECKKNHSYSNIRFVSNVKNANHFKWNTIKYAYSCDAVFYTHNFVLSSRFKNKNQLRINLWHGCGYKSMEKGKQASRFDYVLVPGNIFIKTKAEFFGVDEQKVLPIGYPRYDYMMKESKSAEDFINRLRLENKRIVIWMPTFRATNGGDYPENSQVWDYELPILKDNIQLSKLDKFCKENSLVLCIKRHPFQKEYLCENLALTNIRFIDNSDLEQNNIELYSMLRYTDALISDYSSVAIDYLLLDKPIAFALDDYEKYKNVRGFVFEDPLKYMPGNHLYTYTDLLEFLDDISRGNDTLKNKRDEIMTDVHNVTNNYCMRVWEVYLNMIKEELD